MVRTFHPALCRGALAGIAMLFVFGSTRLGYAAVKVPAAEPGAEVSSRIELPRPLRHTQQSHDASCWLACAVMVEGYYGKTITEDQLWEKVKSITHSDEKATMAATRRECLIALSQRGGSIEDLREWYQSISLLEGQTGGDFGLKPAQYLYAKIFETKQLTNFKTLAQAISKGEPGVIVVKVSPTNEHAMVVTGIDFDQRGRVVSVNVLNPALPSPGVMKLSGLELQTQLQSILTKSFANKYFDHEREAFAVNRNSRPQTKKESEWKVLDFLK